MMDQGSSRVDLFLSHTHWDHIIGFPFFEPLYERGAKITIWSPAGAGRTCKELFHELLATEFFPVRLDELLAQLEFRTAHQKTPVSVAPLLVDFHNTNHPGISHCFKITTPHQTIGCITDNEMLQGYHGSLEEISPDLLQPHESLIDFFQNCDLLIHEAQYFPEEYLKKEGWGHSSVQNVIAFIERVRPKEWLVVHHDPKHTDDDLDRLASYAQQRIEERKIPCKVKWLPDNHVIPLS
jgi:ribonuclease BN (tRNA processing enzyme)